MRKIKPVKVAMLGKIRSGKDTVAHLIAHELDKIDSSKPTQFLKFSSGIWEAIELFFPEVLEQGKPRKHLQHIGQVFRELNPDVWVNRLFNSLPYKIAKEKGFNIIVTDTRQPNEVKRLRDEGFKIIKVVADDEVRLQRMIASGDKFNPDDLNHETEKVIDLCPYDYLIDNSYSINDLEERVVEVLEEVIEYE